MDAEDVVQIALEKVLKCGKPIERLRPYVFTVIKNEVWGAAQYYRSGLKYGSLDTDLRLESPEPATDPSSAVDLRWDLEVALNCLPPQQRRTMYHRMRGDTQAETAAAMGITPGTVASHSFRALRTLKLALIGLGVGLVGLGAAWWRFGRLRTVLPSAGVSTLRTLLQSSTNMIIFGLVVCLGVFVIYVSTSPYMTDRRMRRRDETQRLEAEAVGSTWNHLP